MSKITKKEIKTATTSRSLNGVYKKYNPMDRVITDDDGIHYITNEITNTEIQARKNHELSIIRCSDFYEW